MISAGASPATDASPPTELELAPPERSTNQTGRPPEAPRVETELVVEELLVEDVSIDGMCGVY